MEYNTSRSRMLMPEYGRNVQKMVEYLMTIEDRQKRLQQAELLIEMMGILTPHLKTIEDYNHKLWDHLFQMTEFKLDVDGPYPCPSPESVFKKPDPLPYPQQSIRHRHLGRNLQGIIDKALAETDEEKKYGLTQAIGYYMKLAYGNWHREPVHDDMIRNELAELSGGRLRYEPGGFRVTFDNPAQNNNRNFKQRNGGNNNNNRNFKNNNNNQGGGGQRNNYNQGSGNNPNNFGGNNFNNKNRKFKNNKNK